MKKKNYIPHAFCTQYTETVSVAVCLLIFDGGSVSRPIRWNILYTLHIFPSGWHFSLWQRARANQKDHFPPIWLFRSIGLSDEPNCKTSNTSLIMMLYFCALLSIRHKHARVVFILKNWNKWAIMTLLLPIHQVSKQSAGRPCAGPQSSDHRWDRSRVYQEVLKKATVRQRCKRLVASLQLVALEENKMEKSTSTKSYKQRVILPLGWVDLIEVN